MLGFDLQATINPDEQDALLAHYVKDAATYRKIVALYVARYGILPELGGPQPDESPAESTRRPFLLDGDTLVDEAVQEG